VNAFPQTNDRVVKALSIAESQGMTLRDYFAAKAMQGFIAYATAKGIYAPPDNELASASYQLADAMMEARNVAQ
jgi:2-methylcitrate dehydratase PrpD